MNEELKEDLEELEALIDKIGKKHDLYYMSMCKFRESDPSISFAKEEEEKIQSLR